MEIRASWIRPYDYKLKLNPLDIAAITGAIREERQKVSEEGEMPTHGNFESRLSKMVANKNAKVLRIMRDDLASLARYLNEFADNTPERIAELPEVECTSAFVNSHIDIRTELGHHALTLVDQLNQHKAAELAQADFDTGLRQLLAEHSPDQD